MPSKTIQIPLKVFSGLGPDGMIRLPTDDQETGIISASADTHDEDDLDERRFHDEDDDIPPPVPSKQTFKAEENEEDFFDVSEGEDDEVEDIRPAGQDEGTKAWRD